MTIRLWPLFSVPSRSAYSLTKTKSSWQCTSYPCKLLSSPARHPRATRDGTTARIQTRTRRVSAVYFFRNPWVRCSTSFTQEEQQKLSPLLEGFCLVFPSLVDLFASAIIYQQPSPSSGEGGRYPLGRKIFLKSLLSQEVIYAT
jgi:hypothetical protein